MKWSASILDGAVLMACLPDTLGVAGKRCAADRPCGSGFTCIDGACTAGDAGSGPGPNVPSPNLLVNGDFERGDLPEGWSSITGVELQTETYAHDGARAVSVGLGADGLRPAVPPVSSSQADTLYGARAYVWCGGAKVVLAIAEGDVDQPAALFQSSPLATSGKWTEIRASGRALGGRPLTVELWSEIFLGTFCADDFKLWVSASSTCE